MGLFTRLLGRTRTEETADPDAPCPHTRLAPQWLSLSDRGQDEKITRYACECCGRFFSLEEGRTVERRGEEREPVHAGS